MLGGRGKSEHEDCWGGRLFKKEMFHDLDYLMTFPSDLRDFLLISPATSVYKAGR